MSSYILLLCLFASPIFADGNSATGAVLYSVQRCPPCAPCQCTTQEPPQKECKKDYIIVKNDVTWYDAIRKCKQLGRELVAIENIEQWIDVKRAAILDGPPTNYWTSGSRQGHDSFVWTTSWRPFNFTVWYTGQPDNHINGRGEHQECVYISSQINYTWNDISCHTRMHYMCEKCVH